MGMPAAAWIVDGMIFAQRRFWLAVVLLIAVALTLFTYWPRKKSRPDRFGGGPPGPPPELFADPSSPEAAEQEARFQSLLKSLPEDRRKDMEARHAADQAFVAAIKDLPEQERREKLREHFRQLPPPGGDGPPRAGTSGPSEEKSASGSDSTMGAAGGGSSGSGRPGDPEGPGGDRGVRIPPVEQRHSMDKHIADSMRQLSHPSQQ